MFRRNLFATVTLLTGVVLMLSSCRDKRKPGWEYMPDMYRGPAVETYQPDYLMKDSLSALQPVEGTIPRNFMWYKHYPNTAEGYEEAKANLKIPASIPNDSVTLAEGAELFGIFCVHCHGAKGDGQGVLVQRGKFLGVPNYADRDINLGSIFYVITNGKGVMGSHASQVTPEERWKLARYVMKLRSDLLGGSSDSSATATTATAKDSTNQKGMNS